MAAQFRPTRIEISLDNLQWNYRLLQSLVPKASFFCPMIKANAYGHGDFETAKTLESIGAKRFGVALLEEGRGLRQKDVRSELIVFHPTLDRESIEEMEQFHLTPVVSSVASLKVVIESRYKGGVHLKFNTGMNRLGIDTNEFSEIFSLLRNRPFRIDGVCTHLQMAEDLLSEASTAEKQIRSILTIGQTLNVPKNQIHVFNSSGILGSSHLKKAEWDELGARPGVSLYGIQPDLFDKNSQNVSTKYQIPLKPALSVKTQIIQAHAIEKGDWVSYGQRWQAKEKTVVGVVPMGYADGYSRQFSNRGTMLVDGEKKSVAGIVCMDFTILDLGNKHEDKWWIGKEVVVIGEQNGKSQTASELAQQTQTNAYEIMTHFSSRVPRYYL